MMSRLLSVTREAYLSACRLSPRRSPVFSLNLPPQYLCWFSYSSGFLPLFQPFDQVLLEDDIWPSFFVASQFAASTYLPRFSEFAMQQKRQCFDPEAQWQVIPRAHNTENLLTMCVATIFLPLRPVRLWISPSVHTLSSSFHRLFRRLPVAILRICYPLFSQCELQKEKMLIIWLCCEHACKNKRSPKE